MANSNNKNNNKQRRSRMLLKLTQKKGVKNKAQEHKITTAPILVPIKITLSSEVETRKSVIALKRAKKVGNDTTNMFISQNDSIVKMISKTNSRLVSKHNRGEIDLTGEGF